jgi:hypothetical protein
MCDVGVQSTRGEPQERRLTRRETKDSGTISVTSLQTGFNRFDLT